jgi:hypothetical protein
MHSSRYPPAVGRAIFAANLLTMKLRYAPLP